LHGPPRLKPGAIEKGNKRGTVTTTSTSAHENMVDEPVAGADDVGCENEVM